MPHRSNAPKYAALVILSIFLAAGVFGALTMFMYNGSLSPVSNADCVNPTFTESEECKPQSLVIDEGMSTSDIANALKEKGLIQNRLTFQIYAKFNNFADKMQAGKYHLNKTMSVQKIVSILVGGETVNETYRITTLPGGTLSDFKDILLEKGFSSKEIEDALAKVSGHPILASKPPEASLEGYIFGETIEFEPSASAEDIITAFLDEFLLVSVENNLEERFAAHNLSFHEGIILASIIQKEARTEDMKNVASVFYNRLGEGMTLGSDVTASYAANQVDINREIYTDNAAVLAIDSCYNTRINTGLPCGPISNPGLDALLAVAEPSETPYFYFLTGDDGMMYYGITDSDHQMNIETHCQELCNIQL